MHDELTKAELIEKIEFQKYQLLKYERVIHDCIKKIEKLEKIIQGSEKSENMV